MSKQLRPPKLMAPRRLRNALVLARDHELDHCDPVEAPLDRRERAKRLAPSETKLDGARLPKETSPAKVAKDS
jgi:hypothetical protein